MSEEDAKTDFTPIVFRDAMPIVLGDMKFSVLGGTMVSLDGDDEHGYPAISFYPFRSADETAATTYERDDAQMLLIFKKRDNVEMMKWMLEAVSRVFDEMEKSAP